MLVKPIAAVDVGFVSVVDPSVGAVELSKTALLVGRLSVTEPVG